MSDVLCFYFDGTVVQAVQVCITNSSTTVKDARTFPFDELDDYLAQCREKSCIICSNPPLFYQDTINLPPAAHKLYGTLVRADVQKTHPDLTSFSVFHRTIGEATIDNLPYSKIAAFSYPDQFLSSLIQTLNRHSIAISRVYAAPIAISRLAASTCTADPDKTRIFVATLPEEKLLLVCENNMLSFIRKLPSVDSTMLPEDAQNINMTVDYCFQSLRVRPFEAVLLSHPGQSEAISPLVSLPFRSLLPEQLDGVPPELIKEYLAPIAAVLHSIEFRSDGDILPSSYAAFSMHKKLFSTATILMFVLTLLLAGYLVKERLVISGLKANISKIRIALSGSANELATFKKLDAETSLLKQPLDFINRHNASLNPALALAALTLPESSDYLIKGVTVQSGDDFLTVQIEGILNTAGYTESQSVYEGLVARVSKTPGYTVSSSTVDVKLKTFGVQARYNGRGQQAR